MFAHDHLERKRDNRYNQNFVPQQQDMFVQNPGPMPRNNINNFGNTRKSLPVNQWRLTFSGDGTGLHLYDFLMQVRIFQRSEQVSNNELLFSFMFLLSGRARLWYQSLYNTFNTFDELVAALKREFLPANYDYVLLASISNRTQRMNESVGEYITHVLSLFQSLAIPISEQHKVHIVRTNLQQKYTIAIAIFEFNTIGELSEVGKRIDNATVSVNKPLVNLPFQYSQPNTRPIQSSNNRYNVHVLDEPAESHCITDDYEVCALKDQKGPNEQGEQTKCWNCKRSGHIFRKCNEPRSCVFCYWCGAPDVTVRTCRGCWEGKAQRDEHTSRDNDNTNIRNRVSENRNRNHVEVEVHPGSNRNLPPNAQ